MSLDITSISQSHPTIDEAASLLLYSKYWVDDPGDDWLFYNSLEDDFCFELISKFCNYHGLVEIGSMGLFQMIIPTIVYRFKTDLTVVEGAAWENGIFAHQRGANELWQFAVKKQTAEIYNYPMPS